MPTEEKQSRSEVRPTWSSNMRTPWGENIRDYRKMRNLKREELAEMCGLQKETITHYENGRIKNPPIENLVIILRALNTTWDQILPKI